MRVSQWRKVFYRLRKKGYLRVVYISEDMDVTREFKGKGQQLKSLQEEKSKLNAKSYILQMLVHKSPT